MKAVEREQLRRLAEGAGAETWTIQVFAGDVWREEDGRFAAAACPAVVLQLLDGVDQVLALCEEWDRLSKGESPTTRAIRAALDGSGS